MDWKELLRIGLYNLSLSPLFFLSKDKEWVVVVVWFGLLFDDEVVDIDEDVEDDKEFEW